MRIIELDASFWTTPRDVLRALHDAIGLSGVQEWNIDALVDRLIHKPPLSIRVTGDLSAEVRPEIEALSGALKDARTWRRNHRYVAVGTTIQIVP